MRPTLLTLALLASCGGGAGTAPPTTTPDAGSLPIAAADAAVDEPGWEVTLSRTWALKADGLTVGDREVVVRVVAPADATLVRAAVDDGPARHAARGADGAWSVALSVAELPPGEHAVRVASGDSAAAVATRPLQVSFAVYVVVSTDWDNTRFADPFLRRIEALREHHPALVYSHFFAPFHYTDPMVTDAREAEIEAWVKAQRDQHGDELGVHIHGWCHFVSAAGVTCRTQPAYAPDDTSGYVTVMAAYTVEEMSAQLRYAVRLFGEHGLGRPTSFRAGGWTADLGTFRALDATGFTVDSSAMRPDRIGSWRGYLLYSWNETNWAGITDTTQPYYPSDTLITEGAPARPMRLLEVPDNGILVDYITGPAMVAVYEANAPEGRPVARPTLFQVGFHPPNFSTAYQQRMETALTHVDEHLASADRGPAVYARISDLTRVWR
ncbi:MAG: hypothetical protein JWM10_3584 [Myxococcaceae bacterium]|nr:hypothetical protein [Myxococcaceae bacterium]